MREKRKTWFDEVNDVLARGLGRLMVDAGRGWGGGEAHFAAHFAHNLF